MGDIKWNTLDCQPPEEWVEVKNEEGHVGLAMPTYYPWRIENNGEGKWNSKIVQCDPYWDGGWIQEITMDNLDPVPNGEITHWRKLNDDDEKGA